MSFSNEENESIEYSKSNYSEEVEQKLIETNKKLLEEYENRIQNDPSLSSEPLTQEEIEQAKNEDKAIMEQKQKENEEAMKKVLNVVERFYPNELQKILKDAKTQEEAMTSETFVAISEAECDLIELVIEIIEQKDITNEEKKSLKEYLNGTDFKLKEVGEYDLLNKVNEIIKE